jgi:hypothetical protein
MMSKSIERELARIENRVQQIEKAEAPTAAQEQRHAEYLAREEAAYDFLCGVLDTMPREYGETVVDELARVGWKKTRWENLSECSHLARAVCKLALCRTYAGAHFPPPQMPESVCRWFVEVAPQVDYIYGGSGHNCEDCGYWVPSARDSMSGYYACVAQHRNGPTEAMPFSRCPLCNGYTGWMAWSIKNTDFGPLVPYCSAVAAT